MLCYVVLLLVLCGAVMRYVLLCVVVIWCVVLGVVALRCMLLCVVVLRRVAVMYYARVRLIGYCCVLPCDGA